MSDTGKIAANLRRFKEAVNAHDRENPTHNAYGIGLSHFDLERLGFGEGEELWPGIRGWRWMVASPRTSVCCAPASMTTESARPRRPRR